MNHTSFYFKMYPLTHWCYLPYNYTIMGDNSLSIFKVSLQCVAKAFRVSHKHSLVIIQCLLMVWRITGEMRYDMFCINGHTKLISHICKISEACNCNLIRRIFRNFIFHLNTFLYSFSFGFDWCFFDTSLTASNKSLIALAMSLYNNYDDNTLYSAL